jgi:hypothetical protein
VGTSVLKVVPPSSEEVVGEVPVSATEDMDRAVAAARAAFDLGPWPRMTPDERAVVLARAAELFRLWSAEIADVLVVRQRHVQPLRARGTDGDPVEQVRALTDGRDRRCSAVVRTAGRSAEGFPQPAASRPSSSSTVPPRRTRSSRPGKRASNSSRRSRLTRLGPSSRCSTSPAPRNTAKW